MDETTLFQIIAAAGSSRSAYVEAIESAKHGDFDQAESLIGEGEKAFLEGHSAHMSMIQKEASGEESPISLLTIHAEDQLMSAEQFGILARQFIDVYRHISM